jgi:hypothetical protein
VVGWEGRQVEEDWTIEVDWCCLPAVAWASPQAKLVVYLNQAEVWALIEVEGSKAQEASSTLEEAKARVPEMW